MRSNVTFEILVIVECQSGEVCNDSLSNHGHGFDNKLLSSVSPP